MAKAVWWCGAGMALLAGIAVAAPAEAAGGAAECGALSAPGLFGQTTVNAARWVAADASKGLPAFCEVTATVSPVAGSNIGVVYRLPEQWNGKLLGLGGGGWAGNVRIEAAADGLKRGYATGQTNAGHESTSPWDTKWSSNPQAVTDFQYRAMHLMTVTAKAVVARYYGKPQSFAYYQGCSTGGRQGLMEAQRFPGDYDGIIAGAPVYSLQVQTSALLRNKMFQAPGASFAQEQLDMATAAAVAACDAADGLKDGLIGNPRACGWKPSALLCKPGQTANCLNQAQVTALDSAYAGIRAKDGQWAAFPMNKGGESGWSRFVGTGKGGDQTGGGGMIGLAPLLFGGRQVDFANFDPDRDVTAARTSAFAKEYEATNPDLRPFVAHGGKLILWHGESDPGPSPVGTADYYEKVAKAVPQTAQAIRLFFDPGVEHCGGGPGADRPETLSALEKWVEQHQAPATLIATGADGKLTRPLCAYPAHARYKSGDPNQPASFECR